MFNAIFLANAYAKQAIYMPDIKYRSYFDKYVKEAKIEERGIRKKGNKSKVIFYIS